MSNAWLTPVQAAFLERFFATPTGQRFFLTGGTALAAFYLHDLLAKARGKDLGMQPFYMAGTLLQVRQIQYLPATTPVLALPELQAFIVSLSERLIDQMRPQKGRES